MENQFVPYDIAIKLKQKGFDEPCFGYFHNRVEMSFMDKRKTTTNSQQNLYDSDCATPLWQQAFDWILKKLENTNPEPYNRKWSYILKSDDTTGWDFGNGDAYYEFESKEKAIEYALTLI